MLSRFILYGTILITLSFCTNQKDKPHTDFALADDLGISHNFERTPQRIITLAPNLTEMIYDLGQGDKLAGNTLYCDYPGAAKKIEKVGNLLTVNFEKIVTLKPDLVLITVEGNTKETYDKFHQLGIKIFVSNPRNYEGIKKTYLDLGKIFRVEQKARDRIAGWDSTIQRITAALTESQNKSAMFVVDIMPLMLAGKNTFLDEYLRICGLKNIAGDSPMNYPIFSREEVLKRDPDYIIKPTGNGEDREEIKNTYPEWNKLKAIKNKNVIFVDWDLYSRPGPRFTEAVNDLFNRLHHPERQARRDLQ